LSVILCTTYFTNFGEFKGKITSIAFYSASKKSFGIIEQQNTLLIMAWTYFHFFEKFVIAQLSNF